MDEKNCLKGFIKYTKNFSISINKEKIKRLVNTVKEENCFSYNENTMNVKYPFCCTIPLGVNVSDILRIAKRKGCSPSELKPEDIELLGTEVVITILC